MWFLVMTSACVITDGPGQLVFKLSNGTKWGEWRVKHVKRMQDSDAAKNKSRRSALEKNQRRRSFGQHEASKGRLAKLTLEARPHIDIVFAALYN